jgi:hypothetical protein
MFAQAGCDGQHLSEQSVKGSDVPNVICVLPGSSDRVIIVGAHFGRELDSDGVVDNWSSASLLPSLYEALKEPPRAHTHIFVSQPYGQAVRNAPRRLLPDLPIDHRVCGYLGSGREYPAVADCTLKSILFLPRRTADWRRRAGCCYERFGSKA